MLKITDINVSKSYRGGDYCQPFYQTTLGVQIATSYDRVKVGLSDEQTARIVAFILATATEGLTVELEQHEPVTVEEPSPPPLACLAKSDPGEIVL